MAFYGDKQTMLKLPLDRDQDTRLIPAGELGQGSNRGLWATAAYQDGEYGVMLGVTQGESRSAAMFIPESRLQEFRRILPKRYRAVFQDARGRLPQFKLRIGGLKGSN
jgi:hypothetical protein